MGLRHTRARLWRVAGAGIVSMILATAGTGAHASAQGNSDMQPDRCAALLSSGRAAMASGLERWHRLVPDPSIRGNAAVIWRIEVGGDGRLHALPSPLRPEDQVATGSDRALDRSVLLALKRAERAGALRIQGLASEASCIVDIEFSGSQVTILR